MEAGESTFGVSKEDAKTLNSFRGHSAFEQPTFDIAGQEVILRSVTSGRDRDTMYFAFKAPDKVVSFLFNIKTGEIIEPLNCDEAFVADFCEASRTKKLADQ